jgi:hypothetical protein
MSIRASRSATRIAAAHRDFLTARHFRPDQLFRDLVRLIFSGDEEALFMSSRRAFNFTPGSNPTERAADRGSAP